MASAQDVEMSPTTNNPSQYPFHPDDQTPSRQQINNKLNNNNKKEQRKKISKTLNSVGVPVALMSSERSTMTIYRKFWAKIRLFQNEL